MNPLMSSLSVAAAVTIEPKTKNKKQNNTFIRTKSIQRITTDHSITVPQYVKPVTKQTNKDISQCSTDLWQLKSAAIISSVIIAAFNCSRQVTKNKSQNDKYVLFPRCQATKCNFTKSCSCSAAL